MVVEGIVTLREHFRSCGPHPFRIDEATVVEASYVHGTTTVVPMKHVLTRYFAHHTVWNATGVREPSNERICFLLWNSSSDLSRSLDQPGPPVGTEAVCATRHRLRWDARGNVEHDLGFELGRDRPRPRLLMSSQPPTGPIRPVGTYRVVAEYDKFCAQAQDVGRAVCQPILRMSFRGLLTDRSVLLPPWSSYAKP